MRINSKILQLLLFISKSSFTLLFLVSVLLAGIIVNANNMQNEEIIRLHIIANSNSEMDQQLKLQVRDEIIKGIKELMPADSSYEASEHFLMNNLDTIKDIAKSYITKMGFDYDVKTGYGVYDFGQKNYGKITLPAGRYKAVRVEIGEAKGRNWWCVMYPPLCFVDESLVMSEDSIDNLSPKFKLRLKFLELFG